MLKAKIHYTHHLALDQATKDLIRSHIQWELNPESIVKGRSGYVHLSSPLEQHKVQLLKFKGLGYFDPANKTILQPGQSAYDGSKQINDQGITELANRLVVNKNGSFQIVEFEQKPFGGQYLPRVLTEFIAAETLYQPNRPLITYAPIAYAEYTDLKFNDQPLGVVVLGLPSEHLTFLEEYFIFRRQGEQMLISNRFSPSATPPQLFEILHNFCIEIGAKLRIVHRNFVGMEGHLGNCTVIPKTREVLLHDLDYVLQVDQLTDLQKFNYPIRDIASYLTAIITNILFNDLLSFAPQLQHFDENIFHFNFLKGLLIGYEENLPNSLLDYCDQLWKEILVFYSEQLPGLDEQKRLLKIHPFVVEKKISLINELYDLISRIKKIENHKIPYTQKQHHKNVKNVLTALR